MIEFYKPDKLPKGLYRFEIMPRRPRNMGYIRPQDATGEFEATIIFDVFEEWPCGDETIVVGAAHKICAIKYRGKVVLFDSYSKAIDTVYHLLSRKAEIDALFKRKEEENGYNNQP